MLRKYASKELMSDKAFMLRAVAQNGHSLFYSSAVLRRDKEVVLAAVMNDGLSLISAAPKLKADRDVVLIAVAQNGKALCYSSAELREGGLKSYLAEMRLSRIVLFRFLGASRSFASASKNKEKEYRVIVTTPLRRLHCHGFHFACQFSKMVAGFTNACEYAFALSAQGNISKNWR